MFQGFSDPHPEGCEICDASPVERVLYPVAVHFKGSGFYSTDYGRGSRRQAREESGDSKGVDKGDKPDKAGTKEKKEKAAEA